METINALETQAREFAKVQRDKGIDCVVGVIADRFFVVKPINHTSYSQLRMESAQKATPDQIDNPNYVDPTLEENIMQDHILFPDDFKLSELRSGWASNVKEFIKHVSGFDDKAGVVDDPFVATYQKDINDVKAELETQGHPIKSYSVVLINSIPFCIKPVLQSEYISYRAEVEQITNEKDMKIREQKAITTDMNLIKSHIIYPGEELKYAGYIDLVFRAIWAVSGFTDNVQVVEV